MAERLMLVCDTCGRPALETVTFKTSSGNRQRDYCTAHLTELLAGARTPKRGRRPGSTNSKSTAKTAVKNPTARKSTGRKKATRRKSGSKKSSAKAG